MIRKLKKVIIISIILFISVLNPFNSRLFMKQSKHVFEDNSSKKIKSSASVSMLWSYTTGDDIYSSAALGDIDRDGKLEVIIGSHDDNLYALNGEDGSECWVYETGGVVGSDPALGDIDNDGKLEVIVGSWDHNVYALNGEDGSQLWTFTTGGGISPSPSLGDIDNDGELEVVVGSRDTKIYAINGEDGRELWNYTTGDYIYSSAALGDIDGDKKLEVITGNRDGKCFALNGEDGTVLWTFTMKYDLFSTYSLSSSAVVGDVDEDGKLEVLIGGRGPYYDSALYALNGESGMPLWTYKSTYEENLYLSGEHTVALVDIDFDSKLEIVVGNRTVLNGEKGTIVWRYKNRNPLCSSPSIGDVDGDGILEIVVGSYDNKVYAANCEDGTQSWSYETGDNIYSTPVLGDLDGDGKLEVVVGSWDNKIYALNPEPSGQEVCWQGFSGDLNFNRKRNQKYIYGPITDDEAPETIIIKCPSGIIDYDDIFIQWNGTDNISPASELIYSYLLEGFDAQWSNWVSDTEIYYFNLPNGNYTFKVKTKDEVNNIDQTPANCSFEVLKTDISILAIDKDLFEMINLYAPQYYQDFWNLSITQFKSWIALITLREAGYGRYAAHSQTGRSEDKDGIVYCDRFNHRAIGYKFPFSTGIGAFQLDRGGFQGNANENWGTMPTIKKIDPEISLLSVLRWHRDRFNWEKANLADFSEYSAWNAIRPSREYKISVDWKTITGYEWSDCKENKLDVVFNPPIVIDPFENNVKYICKTFWNITNFEGYFDTWLINACSYGGNIVTQYYYTYREDTGYEIWVYNDPEQKYIYRFDRNYAAGQDPEGTKDMGTYFIAGATGNSPALNPDLCKAEPPILDFFDLIIISTSVISLGIILTFLFIRRKKY